VLYAYRAEEKYFLHEFVVMPNHFHLLITPRELTIERAMQLIKGGFSFRARERFGFSGTVWQRSFHDRRVRNAEEYAERREYIQLNPVAARLCARPEDWKYSSASGR
jgi:putative transposase